jgi:hypothetical protein
MVELRVVLSDKIAEHLAERAREEQTTPEQLASQAVSTFLGPTPSGRLPRFVGKGSSGRHDLSERVEEILSADLGS